MFTIRLDVNSRVYFESVTLLTGVPYAHRVGTRGGVLSGALVDVVV